MVMLAARLHKAEFLFAMFLALFAWAKGFSQHPTISFDHLTAEDGLSHSTVYALLQDRDGLVWIGTRYGLNRFNGYDCEVFLPKEGKHGSINGPSIYCLFEDKAGKIWVGHREAGISVWDPDKGQFESFPKEPTKPTIDWGKTTVRSIFEDSRGWLWVGTSGGGAFVFDGNRQQIAHYCEDCEPSSNKLSGDFIFDFIEAPDGKIWIATDGTGINGYDPKAKTIFHLNSGEPLNMLSYEKALCLDRKGHLWIGTSGSGLYRFDQQEQLFQHYYNQGNAPNTLTNNLIRDLAVDSIGQIWIATDGGGLNIYDPVADKFRAITTSANYPQALNTNALYQLIFDRIGNLWVGTFNGGVNIHKAFKSPFFIHENLQEYRRMGLRSVLAIKEDNNGKLWLGSDGSGLFVTDLANKNIKPTEFKALGPTTPKVVTCLDEGPSGELWVGSYAEGLFLYHQRTGAVRHFVHQASDPASLSHNNVWDIAVDDKGGLWVGTLGNGLNYLMPGTTKFKRYLPIPGDNNSLSSVQIVDVLLDSNGKYLWAASEDKGLNRLDLSNGHILSFHKNAADPKYKLSGDNLHCLFQDRDGRIWVGTEFNGLDCIEREKPEIAHFTTADGLPSNMVISITSDKAGKLWIGTQKGIVRFDPASKAITDFGTDENLNNNNYNPRAAIQLRDGRLVYGGTNGFSILSPASIHPNPHAPRVIFTKLKIAGQTVPIGDWNGRTVLSGKLNDETTRVSLSAADRGIVFEFTANDFIAPSKNHFAYRLEGFEEDWNYVGADQHRAVFSNLNGGKYRLRVKAANANGVWGEESSLIIEVQPPFWKTWWFLLLCTSALATIVYFGFKYILDHEKSAFEAQQFRAEQAFMRLKNETLAKEVEDKQRQLSASVLETAHKNQFLVDLKAQIQKIEPQIPELRKLIRAVDSELNQEDYWEQFQLTFNQMHQAFVQKLQEQHPVITNNELRLCCFIRMGMSNAEIATILNITVNGVEQSKYRLKRKIGLEKEASLNDYIKGV